MLALNLNVMQTTHNGNYVTLTSQLLFVVVVLTLTHNTMKSVVAAQAPITLEWKKYLGSKTVATTKTSIRTPPLRTPGKQKGDY